METSNAERNLELCQFIAQHTGFKQVDPSCRIDQLITDSLDFLQMMLDVQAKFETLIPDEEYGSIKTVADLGKLLFDLPS